MGWNREQLEEALRQLDHDIEPLRAKAPDLDSFWVEFDQNARRIQREADADIWYAAAQIDRMLIRHGLMPRPGVYRLPLQRLPFGAAAGDAPSVRADRRRSSELVEYRVLVQLTVLAQDRVLARIRVEQHRQLAAFVAADEFEFPAEALERMQRMHLQFVEFALHCTRRRSGRRASIDGHRHDSPCSVVVPRPIPGPSKSNGDR